MSAQPEFAGAPQRDLLLTRTINAPRELVFKAWIEPERFARWWGPKDFSTPFVNVDPRPGGSFRYCMRSPEGEDFWGKGVFREIVEPERLVFVDSFTDEDGNSVSPQEYGMSSDWPAESLVTVTFAEAGGTTRLTIHSGGLPATEDTDMAEDGWNESLDRLEDYLATA